MLESNNMPGLPVEPIMDFKTWVPGAAGLSGAKADALLLILAGAELPAGLEPALADAARGAVQAGDFKFEAGQLVVLHAPAGVGPRRLVLAAAGKDGGVKGLAPCGRGRRGRPQGRRHQAAGGRAGRRLHRCRLRARAGRRLRGGRLHLQAHQAQRCGAVGAGQG
jgi:hypothetical protein